MVRIEADVLIPGRGDPVRNGAVAMRGATIVYAGPLEGAPRPAADEATVSVPAVMPGLWDVHGHFSGIRSANFEELAHTPIAVLAARAARDAEVGLAAGITSVRELTGLGIHLARLVDEGTLNGPRIYAAGAALTQTGGHGDLHGFPLDFVRSLATASSSACLCDGVAECLRGVRMQLRAGAKVIKVLASGGVASVLDDPQHAQFSPNELAAIVGEAARAGRAVAAHGHGKAGILAAVEAGCLTIEHGSFLDEESAEAMRARGAILVPTRFILQGLVDHAEEAGVADYALRKAVGVNERNMQALRVARKAGLAIAAGSDIYSSTGSPLGWGRNAAEVVRLVEAGMTPLQAIESATANGPRTLGSQAPRSGLLREGYDADVLALAADPTRDIRVLDAPENIRKIWRAGTLVKDLVV